MRLIDLYYTGPQAFREDVNLTKNTMISIATALDKKVADIFLFNV